MGSHFCTVIAHSAQFEAKKRELVHIKIKSVQNECVISEINTTFVS